MEFLNDFKEKKSRVLMDYPEVSGGCNFLQPQVSFIDAKLPDCAPVYDKIFIIFAFKPVSDFRSAVFKAVFLELHFIRAPPAYILVHPNHGAGIHESKDF